MPTSSLKVSYRRVKRPADYESAEALAEIGFIPEDGEDVDAGARLEQMFEVAKEKVQGALGIGGSPKPTSKTNDKDRIAKEEAAKNSEKSEGNKPEDVEEKPKPRRRTTKKTEDKTEDKKSAADMDDDSSEKSEEPPETKKSAADMDDSEDTPSVDVEISTGDMQKAVSEAANRLKSAGDENANVKIKKTLRKFQQDPEKSMPISEIVKEVDEFDREAFIDAFKSLDPEQDVE